MIRQIGLGGFEEISNLVSHVFDLLKFKKVGFAATEEVTILGQERRYVALQIFDLEVMYRFVSRGCSLFLFCCVDFFLFNNRQAPWSLLCRILPIRFLIGAPIER